MKKKVFILIGILVLVIGLGISYAYFSAVVNSTESNSTLVLNSGDLRIDVSGGSNIFSEGINPSNKPFAVKEVTITGKNTTDSDLPYTLKLVVDQNTFSNNAISYSLEGENISNNGYIIDDINDNPINGSKILGSGIIKKGNNIQHKYTIKIYFKETNENQSIDMNKSFYAHIEVEGGKVQEYNTVTVSLDANGGEINQNSKDVIVGLSYGDLPVPTKEGYTFLGWNGKNIFNIDDFVEVYDHYRGSSVYKSVKEVYNGESAWKIYGSLTTEGMKLKYMEGKFKENTQYTFSFNYIDVFYGNNMGILIYLYTSGNRNNIFRYENRLANVDYWQKRIFTSDVNVTINYIYCTYGTSNAYTYFNEFQVEKGTTATPYEPYYIIDNTTVVQEGNHTLKAIYAPN